MARIESLRGAGDAELRDFAILYRANHQARVFEQALRKAGIPYKVSGGQSFFDRAEIRDLCAWLRLLVNSDDDPAFLRAVDDAQARHRPPDARQPRRVRGRWKTSLFEALFAETLATRCRSARSARCTSSAATSTTCEYRARDTTGAEDAKALLLGWLKDIGYEQHLHDRRGLAARSRPRAGANVLDFVDWIARRCGGSGAAATGDEDEAKSVLDVAQTISVIISLAERGDDQNVVTLSTLHAAKGLEWPHVMLAGVNEGLLPFARRRARRRARRGSRKSAA